MTHLLHALFFLLPPMECTGNFFLKAMHTYTQQTQQTLLRAGPRGDPWPGRRLPIPGRGQLEARSCRVRTDRRRGAGARAAKARAAGVPCGRDPPGARSNPGDSREGASACTPGRRPAPAPTTRKDRERWPGPEAHRPGRRLRGVHRLRSTGLRWGGRLASLRPALTEPRGRSVGEAAVKA